MLDKDRPSLEEFHIQLWKKVTSLSQEIKIPSLPVSDTPTLLDQDVWKVRYPRSFKEIISLIIVQWRFPSTLHWRVLLDLSEMNFSWLNSYQRIVIKILLDSEISCEKFLYYSKDFSGWRIFGNLLGNDFRDMKFSFKISRRKLKPPTPSVWRRGYRDKGSRIPDHQWKEKVDFSFTSEMQQIESRRTIEHKTISYILKYLSQL